MSIITTRTVRASSLCFVCAAALAGATCSKSESPTGPSSGPTPGGSPASVQVTVNPNPVPFSGAPITDAASCAGYENTWFYDQVLQEQGGGEVRFTSRVDMFDDKMANNLQGLSIVIPARGTQTIRTRWCSGAGTGHTAQTTFSGTDAQGNTVTVTGPVARLMAR
jgi:hypothetical protein